ncbi:MAG: hypothetical protein AB7U82_13660 [Blastocatellales bacterium]
MKPARLIALAVFAAIAASGAGRSQTTTPTVTENKAPAVKPPVEVVSYKIGVEYYPMLDRPSGTAPPMTAETGDMPRTANEQMVRQSRGRFSVPTEDRRSRGRLRSYLRVIDDAQLVQIVIKNTADRPIKIVEWDFAFPRYENGQLLSRYDVTTKVEIKPGGKKTLKHKLPLGAKRCEVVKVVSDDNQPEKTSAFEAVCGKGFHDPSLLKQKQETISIKRIEYQDGAVWLRP